MTFAPMNGKQRARVRQTRAELRDEQLLAEVARVKALDQERIRAGEIKASDLHFISPELARSAKVTWNFGRSRPVGGDV